MREKEGELYVSISTCRKYLYALYYTDETPSFCHLDTQRRVGLLTKEEVQRKQCDIISRLHLPAYCLFCSIILDLVTLFFKPFTIYGDTRFNAARGGFGLPLYFLFPACFHTVHQLSHVTTSISLDRASLSAVVSSSVVFMVL